MAEIIGINNSDQELFEKVRDEILEYEREEFREFIFGFMTPFSVLRDTQKYQAQRSSLWPHHAQPDFCECL